MKKKLVKVQIKNYEVTFRLDAGLDVTLIYEQTSKKVSKLTLSKTKKLHMAFLEINLNL